MIKLMIIINNQHTYNMKNNHDKTHDNYKQSTYCKSEQHN